MRFLLRIVRTVTIFGVAGVLGWNAHDWYTTTSLPTAERTEAHRQRFVSGPPVTVRERGADSAHVDRLVPNSDPSASQSDPPGGWMSGSALYRSAAWVLGLLGCLVLGRGIFRSVLRRESNAATVTLWMGIVATASVSAWTLAGGAAPGMAFGVAPLSAIAAGGLVATIVSYYWLVRLSER